MKKGNYSNISTEVLVLHELEESKRMGRVCRTLKYQPKLVHVSKGTDLQNTNKVPKPISRLEAEDTKEPRGKHMCELCGVEYLNRNTLITHRMIHTGETPYKCELCEKGFRRSDWLNYHMATHRKPGQEQLGYKMKRKKNQYACDQCKKRFSERRAFESHLRTHTGERPYACTICGKRFYDGGCLRKHLTCHWDDRPYTCSECGHDFKRKGSLNKHKRIHTGEKAYSCKACGKSFRYRYSVTLHLKTCKKSKYDC